jgi:hypothetical protein
MNKKFETHNLPGREKTTTPTPTRKQQKLYYQRKIFIVL